MTASEKSTGRIPPRVLIYRAEFMEETLFILLKMRYIMNIRNLPDANPVQMKFS